MSTAGSFTSLWRGVRWKKYIVKKKPKRLILGEQGWISQDNVQEFGNPGVCKYGITGKDCCASSAQLWVCSSRGKEVLTQHTIPNKSKQFHGSISRLHFPGGLLCVLCCLKTFQELGEPQYHQYQRIIIKRSKSTCKSTVLGGVCGSFVPLRSQFWDISLSFWRAARAAESWALWKTLFGCQWRIIWLLLPWKSSPLFLGILNSWSYLLAHLVFSVGDCDFYLGHWLLYLSQLTSYLCCAYF